MRAAIRKLGELCRAWGGELRFFSRLSEFDAHFALRKDELSLAPFAEAHGIDWSSKHVITIHGWESIGAVIHEMGHVFASTLEPNDENVRDEFEFFGWEIAVAKMIGSFRTWSTHTDDYQVTDAGRIWRDCAGHERRRIVAERTSVARELGLLDDFMRPVSIR